MQKTPKQTTKQNTTKSTDTSFPSVHTWVTVQLTKQTLIFVSSVYYLPCNSVQELEPLTRSRRNGSAIQTRSRRLFPALKSLQSRKLPHLGGKARTFLGFFHTRKKMKWDINHSRHRHLFLSLCRGICKSWSKDSAANYPSPLKVHYK